MQKPYCYFTRPCSNKFLRKGLFYKKIFKKCTKISALIISIRKFSELEDLPSLSFSLPFNLP